MKIQSLKQAKPLIHSYIQRFPSAKLFTLFSKLREQERLSFFGDWPLLAEVVHCCASKNKYFTQKEIAKACRQTNDPILQNLRSDSLLVVKLACKDELECLK